MRSYFPASSGYDDTVIPEINLALMAGHDMLFLGEKGQAKSRLMRSLVAVSRRGDPLPRRAGFAGPRRPVSPDHAPLPQFARRTCRRGGADRLVAARASLRRAAVAGHQVRRHHRRDRSGQAGRRREHVGRGGAALRPDSADASRHLRDERAARTGRAGAGRACSTSSKSATCRFAATRSASTSTC